MRRWEKPLCVCASPGRPRALVAVGARVTPPLALGGSAGPSARGHARCLPSRPLCVSADSSRPGRGRPGCVGAPSALVSQPLSWGCSPPAPPWCQLLSWGARPPARAWLRVCSRDPPPCSSALVGVRPRVSPRAWVLASACSPGCGLSFESVGERSCTSRSSCVAFFTNAPPVFERMAAECGEGVGGGRLERSARCASSEHPLLHPSTLMGRGGDSRGSG